MSKVNVYKLSGDKEAAQNWPKEMSAKENQGLLAQAMHIYQDRSHKGAAYAKTRAEVNITKKKIYAQKGTGGARHGARSAHIFVGGGVAHGPKGVKRILELPQAMRIEALKVALSKLADSGRVVAVEGLSEIKKTKEAGLLLNTIKKDLGQQKMRFTFVLKEDNSLVNRSLRNLKDAQVVPYRSLNARVALLGGVLVLDKNIFWSTPAKASTAKKGKTK